MGTMNTSITIAPMSGNIGAEIHGIDLTLDLPTEMIVDIRSALITWKVIFFRDQHISPADHRRFASYFGQLTPAHPVGEATLPDYPEILDMETRVPGDADEAQRIASNIENLWHSDVSFEVDPPMGSILRSVVVPPFGGDTHWTNMVAAYQKLSPQIQRLCDEMHAVHRYRLPPVRGHIAVPVSRECQAKPLRAVHPVVRVHPESGERALFVNPGWTDYIVELTRRESNHLLGFLYEHIVSPDNTCRFRWHTDSIAFWDNRVTCHLVPGDLPLGSVRQMQRIMIAGDRPIAPDGTTSYDLEEG